MVDMSRRFQEKYGRVPDHNAFKGYIGVHMLKAAVQRAGSWDQAKVRACLHNNVFTTAEEPGLLMDVYVNDKGGLDRPSFIVEVKDQKSVVTKTVGMLRGPYTARSCK
jgi:branched-chain amino acid transport system substrate-binding protein